MKPLPGNRPELNVAIALMPTMNNVLIRQTDFSVPKYFAYIYTELKCMQNENHIQIHIAWFFINGILNA